MNLSTVSGAKLSLAAAVALFITVTPARAALLSQSIGFDLVGETRGTSPRLDFSAAVPLFDPALGTLNQVDLTYNFDLSLSMSVSNRTLSPATFNLGPTSLIVEGQRFFDRFNLNNLVASVPIDETYTAPAGTRRTIGSITLTLPGRVSDEYVVDSRFSRTSRPLVIRNIVLRPQGDVSPFVGIGDMTLEFAALTRAPLDLPSSGSILSGISSSTSWSDPGGSVDITYDYTPFVSPVPVPAAGLLGLGFAARRRIGKAA